MNYCPDRWCVIHIKSGEHSHYRVFASWYGGYVSGDSWKMNSGIISLTEVENAIEFTGMSGSVYTCANGCYGLSAYGESVLGQYVSAAAARGVDIIIMPEHTLWHTLDYETGAK